MELILVAITGTSINAQRGFLEDSQEVQGRRGGIKTKVECQYTQSVIK